MSKPDVIVSYVGGDGVHVERTLRGVDTIASRESTGLWKVGKDIWKVYAKRTVMDKLEEDYYRASVMAALPMGEPSFVLCTVKVGAKAASPGFFIKTLFVGGTNFQKGNNRPFLAALEAQKIPKKKTDETYIRSVSTRLP